MKIWGHMIVVLRLLLGGVFLWAGWTKVIDPTGFVLIVGAYKVLPPTLVVPVAVTLPWLELITGICLVLGLWSRSSALIAVVLLAGFGVALGINIYRGADIFCGCFGIYDDRGSLKMALVQDGLLMAAAWVVLARTLTGFQIKVIGQAPRDREDALPGDERRGAFRQQVVDVRCSQPGHLEHVGEPFGREMAEPDALALNHRVHAYGGPVAEMDDLARSDAEARLELTETLQHLGARSVGARRHLQGLCFQGGLVEHGEVGERASDIDSDAIGHPDSPARPPVPWYAGPIVRSAHKRANPSRPEPVCQTARRSGGVSA